ncbi:MAG: hypothetical protein R8G34_03090 [Paracoccaceae bacterium]|nr:hypothetical protein [Paracoccaceae bacterium]
MGEISQIMAEVEIWQYEAAPVAVGQPVELAASGPGWTPISKVMD